MPESWNFGLTLAAALGSGLIAGIFFAFSSFVMKALFRLPPAEGIAAMQAINVVVINPFFMIVFLGTVVLSVVALVSSLMRWQRPGSGYLLAGVLLYLLATFLVTMIFNVPLNDSLARLSASDAESARQWADYVGRWTMWNHVRMAGALLASASFIVAMVRQG
jgi:uncharacterized membrane protein